MNKEINKIKNPSWIKIINKFIKKNPEKWNKICKHVYQTDKTIYPKKEDIFRCFQYFEMKDTKVVFLGMDPYIRENQAMGLSFSVPKTEKVPPSLKNIFTEIETDLNGKFKNKKNGDLTNWAKYQNILLLNSALTVKAGQSGSHLKYWERFTDC